MALASTGPRACRAFRAEAAKGRRGECDPLAGFASTAFSNLRRRNEHIGGSRGERPHLCWTGRKTCYAVLMTAFPLQGSDLFFTDAANLPLSTYVYELVVAGVAAAALSSWLSRPLGSSSEMLEVRESPIHGKGVYARCFIPEGIELGCYPGVPRPVPDMVAKAQRAPGSKDYCFVTEGGVPLDPTNRFGELSPWPEGSWWPFPDNVTLARVNEPSPGSSVSVEGNTVGRLGRKVVFVTTRDVQEGEELFMDYGRSFDRSGYGDY